MRLFGRHVLLSRVAGASVRCLLLGNAVAARLPRSPNQRSPGRPEPPGKVRDIYDSATRSLIVATDRISAFDYVLGSASRTRDDPHPDLGVLVRAAARHRANHLLAPTRRLSAAGPRCAELLRGRVDARAAHDPAAHRVRGARLSRGLRLEGLPRDGAVCGIPLPPACRNRRACRSRSSRRPRRPSGPRRATSARPRRPSSSAPTPWRALGALTLRLYAGRRPRRIARHHRRRHQVRVRAVTADGESDLSSSTRCSRPIRRASGRRTYAPGGSAAQLRQTVRPRLARSDSVEQTAAGAGAARRRGQRTREKYLEAFRRLTGRDLQ